MGKTDKGVQRVEEGGHVGLTRHTETSKSANLPRLGLRQPSRHPRHTLTRLSSYPRTLPLTGLPSHGLANTLRHCPWSHGE